MRPLEGIRVLELTHMVSGPYAGMILADQGAETIKIEPPGGEMTRRLMADEARFNVGGMGPYFLSLNRNKKSVTLDLKTGPGRELFYELVRISDVVLNNYRAGVMERLELGYAQLSGVNPRIITCSITGFGETGPDRGLPAYDMVVQAMSGVMSVTGAPHGPPARAGIPISDVSGSLMGAVGILTALVARQRTGRGRHVDISMLDAQVSALNYMAAAALLAAEPPERLGSAHRNHVPYNVYPCADGHLILAVVTDEFWAALVDALGLTALAGEAFATRQGRLAHRERIDAALAQHFLSGSRAHWIERLRPAGIPCAPVNDFLEALDEPQLEARGMVASTRREGEPAVRMPGNAVHVTGSEPAAFIPAPRPGEHNEEILGGLLGKTEADLAALRSAGVI